MVVRLPAMGSIAQGRHVLHAKTYVALLLRAGHSEKRWPHPLLLLLLPSLPSLLLLS